MAKRREFNVFSLSFLDIMSCGFGAVILIFIIIQHKTSTENPEFDLQLMAEVTKLEEEIEIDTEYLVQLKNTLKETDDKIVTTTDMTIEIIRQIRELQALIDELSKDGQSKDDSIEDLKNELKKLEKEAASLEGSVAASDREGESLRAFAGEGNRQYLTGLRMGGENILILVDASASMLDREIVNVVRLRNLPPEARRRAAKWQRAIRTVEWIVANMPPNAEFQLATFNTEVNYVLPETAGNWIPGVDRGKADAVLAELKEVTPGGGTSLFAPFQMMATLDPPPDNVYLLVDSLPTQGEQAPRSTVVESNDRVEHFYDSLDQLPNNVPINTILFPMEGDPEAAYNYWLLAFETGGSLLAPPDDWP